jgi:hypothetical protein
MFETGQPQGDGDVSEVRELVRAAAARAIARASRGTRPDGDLRANVKALCDAARQSGLQAEMLVLMVKDCWRNFGAPALMERHLADAALESLVTMCISEFYNSR